MAAGNSVWDEIREQNKKMKGKPFKEQFQYFWEYYRVPTLVTIFVVVFIINLIHTMVTATDNGLGVILVNGYADIDTSQYMIDFEEYVQMDTKEYSTYMEVNFTVDAENYDEYVMANVQKFSAMVAANQLDVVIGDEDTVLGYAEPGYFHNLTDILPADVLEAHKDQFIYFDIPDDNVEGEVPVGINISETSLIADSGAYLASGGEAYFAVIGNTMNAENVAAFLEYIETVPVLMME